MIKITTRNLTAGYGKKEIIKDISMEISSGEILTLLGPNGEGKTTLLKTICGLKKPMKGEIYLGMDSIKNLNRKEISQKIAYVPQIHHSGIPLKVLDMTLLGRCSTRGFFSSPTEKDYDYANNSLILLEIEDLSQKIFTNLSGGEQRLVLIARALAQSADFLFLDEPVSNLDLGNQIRVLKVLHKLAADGIGIMMSSHYPDHSLWLSARTAILQNGNLTNIDKAKKVITSTRLSNLYNVPIKVKHNQGSYYCEPDFIKELTQ